MILSALRVLKLNKEHHLIEGLSKRELKNPEGIDLELRVGRIEEIVSDSFLGIEERSSAKTELIADIETDGQRMITMKPGDYFIVRTIEKVNCPSYPILYEKGMSPRHIVPDIKPRVSLQKAGVGLYCSTTNPGYSGQLWFGLKNDSKYNFKFELGARMFKIYWHTVTGDIKRSYSGQHQGGRTTSQGKTETQT
jgi:deoxycytidine triphosphate deaminase